METLKKAKEFFYAVVIFDLVFVGAAIDGTPFRTCLIALIPAAVSLIGIYLCDRIRRYLLNTRYRLRRAWRIEWEKENRRHVA